MDFDYHYVLLKKAGWNNLFDETEMCYATATLL